MQASGKRTNRRRNGVFYTPEGLADKVAELVLDGFCALPSRIADPCCGDGALLAAAWRYGRGRGWDPAGLLGALLGVDIDAGGIRDARDRLRCLAVQCGVDGHWADGVVERNLVVADGLDAELGPCDAVLTNPPFGNAIESDTARTDAEREQHRRVAPEVVGGAYDRSVVFAARALGRLRAGGRYGIILPRSVLSVDSARDLRDHFDLHGAPEAFASPDSSQLFANADVFVTAIIGARGASPTAVQVGQRVVARTGREVSWAELVDPAAPLLRAVLASPAPLEPLGEHYGVRGGATTADAYELAPGIEEEGDGLRLVTTGLIDRYACLWGQRRCRYLKRDYARPTWPADAAGSVGRAAARQRAPKVLVGGLSRVIEAVADPDGVLGGVVSTWVVTPGQGPLALPVCEALLNAPVLALVYATRNRGKELSGGNITVGKRELSALPVPADIGALAQTRAVALADNRDPFDLDPTRPDHRAVLAATAAAAVQRVGWAPLDNARDARAAAAIARLYGLDRALHAEVGAWFDARARRV